MPDCNYVIEREVNGVIHKFTLTRDEVSAIWAFYDDVLAEELIINKLKEDYGVKDVTLFTGVIGDLLHRYNKNRGYGCDEESSISFAFEEVNDALEEALKKYNKTEE